MAVRIIGNDDALYQVVKRNKVIYFLIMSVFMVGVLSGSIYFKSTATDRDTSKYLQESFSKINDSDTSFILRESLMKNMTISIFFWILGASAIACPILMGYIAYKGFTLGFTISSLIYTFGFTKGNYLSFILLFFQSFFLFLAMLIAMASSIKLLINLLFKKKDVKIELLRHSIICIVSLAFFVCSSFVDYLTKGSALMTILDKI